MAGLIIDKQIKNARQWNDFLLQNGGHFLQSFEWGKLQEMEGRKVWRLAVLENNKNSRSRDFVMGAGEILAVCLLIKHNLPLGKSFFYIPFGPCFADVASAGEVRPRQNWTRSDLVRLILEKVRELAGQENTIFLHFEPYNECFVIGLQNIWLRESGQNIQPEKTLALDLGRDVDGLLAGFAQKTRYNIHLAQRKGVEVEIGDRYQPIFYQLLQKTARRREFTIFPEKHYSDLFKAQSNNFKARLFLAGYQGKIIAAYILILFGQTATCLHGASDKQYSRLKAVDLLEWERIKYAKEAGCKQIDFWGIDEKKWPGIAAFKKGFGGQEITYPQRYDFIFQKNWYKIYKCCKKLLKKS